MVTHRLARLVAEGRKVFLKYFHRFLLVFFPPCVSLTPVLRSVLFPSLDSRTHQLTTVWSGEGSLDQSVCNHLQIFLMERGWTGKLVRADCGLAGFDYCGLDKGEDLVVTLDIRQCRVRQFRWGNIEKYLQNICVVQVIPALSCWGG